MASPECSDESVVEELLSVFRDEEVETPPGLPDRTIRKVEALLTTRDLVDLTTVVFLLRFCAPLLDLVAAFLGWDADEMAGRNRRNRDE